MIPLTIFQTYNTKKLPDNIQKIKNTWIEFNPEFKYFLYDDGDCNKFIKDKFDDMLYNLYCKLPPGKARVELFKYCILYIHGGVYVDIDTICLSKLNNLECDFIASISNNIIKDYNIEDNKLMISKDFIAAIPNHPILLQCIELIKANIHKNIISRELENKLPLVLIDLIYYNIIGKSIERYIKFNNSDLNYLHISENSFICINNNNWHILVNELFSKRVDNKLIKKLLYKEIHLQRVKIYGERCSGTNYLQFLLTSNFEISTFNDKYGHKHFFGFQDKELEDSDDTLFICIIRDPIKWINSLYKDMFHLSCKYVDKKSKLNTFLNDEIYSVNDYEKLPPYKEIMEDRNIYTGDRYKNIFELRYTKIQFLTEDLPKKVKHYIIIKYEDLLNNFEDTMKKIQSHGLKIKDNIRFPLNTDQYKDGCDPFIKLFSKSTKKQIPDELIINNPNYNKEYEIKLGYN